MKNHERGVQHFRGMNRVQRFFEMLGVALKPPN